MANSFSLFMFELFSLTEVKKSIIEVLVAYYHVKVTKSWENTISNKHK